jgi:agmatinase
VSDALDYLPAARSFLDPVRADAGDPASARAVAIPFGLEASVSYGGGTAAGPAAILAASRQLELYDEELGKEAYLDYGVAAVREPAIARPIAAALSQLERFVEAVVTAGKFPFVLGGEHALTAGAIRPFARRYKDLVVLQFDAHADLRDGYQGEHFSHAAAMRRVLDHASVSLVSVGIRAVSKAEVESGTSSRW